MFSYLPFSSELRDNYQLISSLRSPCREVNNISKVNPRMPRFHLSVQPELYSYWKLHTGGYGVVSQRRVFLQTAGITALTFALFQAAHSFKNAEGPASTNDAHWQELNEKYLRDSNATVIRDHQLGKPIMYREPEYDEEKDGN